MTARKPTRAERRETDRARQEWLRLERATRPDRPRQPTRVSVVHGLAWGPVFAALAPIAVVVMVAIGDNGTGTGGNTGLGSSGATAEQRKPRKTLQYWITAMTAVVIDIAILSAVWYRS